MNQHDIETAKRDELWHLYGDLKKNDEARTANILYRANWTALVQCYPDLTAEEIAFAVCGGVGL